MSHNQISPLDSYREVIEDLTLKGTSSASIARHITALGQKTSKASVHRALQRWGVARPSNAEVPGLTLVGHEAEIISKPEIAKNELTSPDDLMIERGLDPKEWEVMGMTINEWEGAPVKLDQKEGISDNRKYRQLKIRLRRKLEFAFPKAADRIPGSYIAPKKISLPKSDGDLVVFTGDQQAPFHDEHLHQQFCEWLKKNKPTRGILIGDTVDFPDISRHRFNPEGSATVQECINAGYNIIRDYVKASPNTRWSKLCGNHDERIRNTLIDWAVEMYGIKRAEIDGQDESSVLSVAHLLRLDELGVEYLEPNGSYQHMQYNISSKLAARHGWIATKGSGASALKTLEHLGYSVVVGHTHRQSLVHKTTHDIQGEPTTLAAVETGCMCQIRDGLGYTVAPDWQNGFATARVWSDGKFKLDLATFVNDTLLWRDQRFG